MKFALLIACLLLVLVEEIHCYRNQQALIQKLQERVIEQANKKSSKKTKYDNAYDKPLSVQCKIKKGEAMYKVKSRYSNYRKDRQWDWSCRKAASKSLDNCKWTSTINNWQEPIRFMCPKNKFISGVKSKHFNKKEDRKWKVLCCEAKGYHTEGCSRTRNLNQYKEVLSYTADKGKDDNGVGVFVGLDSEFDPEHNDRRWQLSECTLVKDDKKPSREEKSKSKDEKTKSKSKKEKSSSGKKKSQHSEKKEEKPKPAPERKEEKPCNRGEVPQPAAQPHKEPEENCGCDKDPERPATRRCEGNGGTRTGPVNQPCRKEHSFV